MSSNMKKYIAAVLCASAIFGMAANADGKITAKCSLKEVSISGEASDGIVSVIVTTPKYSGYDAVDVSDISDGYEYANHIDVINGKYSVKYSMLDTDLSGTYNVFVRDGDEVYSSSYDYASAGDRQRLIDEINSAEDYTSFCKDIFENNSVENNMTLICGAIGFNMEYYNGLEDSFKQSVAKDVFRGGVDYTGEDAAAELADVFNKSVSVQYVNKSATVEEMKKAIEDHAETIGINLKDERWSKLTADEKELVYNAMLARIKKNIFADAAEVRFAFASDVCIPYVNNIAYGDFESYINKYNDYLKLDIASYNSLSSTGKINTAKAMAKDTFASIEDIQKKFNKYVSENKNIKDFSGGTPSGGGTGKGSSSPAATNGVISSSNLPSEESIFRDIDSSHWAYEFIKKLTDKNVVSGDEHGNFRPNDSITRAEFIKCLVVAAGIYDENAECEFDDVEKDSWYYRYIASAYNKGLINGVDKNLFEPLGNIKRQDIAVMIYRTGKIGKSDKHISFNDSGDISDYAAEAVDTLAAAGVISGSNGSFMPMNNATRAETAKLLCGIL